MEIKHNVVGWFEIPVTDLDRAIAFYNKVFGFEMTRSILGTLEMAYFPSVPGTVGSMGALAFHPEFYKPSADGTVVYFTAFSGDVSIELSRVEAAGGKVVMPRKQISEEIGYMGLFIDTEGNRIAVHSHK
jgi:uncharacterized protein